MEFLFKAVTEVPLTAVSFMGALQLIAIAGIAIFRAKLSVPAKGIK